MEELPPRRPKSGASETPSLGLSMVRVVGFCKPVDHLSPTCDPGNIRIGYRCGPNLHPRKPQAPSERRPSATHSPPARSISVAQCTLRRATRWQLCRQRLSYEIMENHGQSGKNERGRRAPGKCLNSTTAGLWISYCSALRFAVASVLPRGRGSVHTRIKAADTVDPFPVNPPAPSGPQRRHSGSGHSLSLLLLSLRGSAAFSSQSFPSSIAAAAKQALEACWSGRHDPLPASLHLIGVR